MEIQKQTRQHTLAIFQNIIVPESHDVKAIQPQRSRSHLIVFHVIGMLAAVEFNDEPSFQANEIHDKTKHWKLAPKLVPC